MKVTHSIYTEKSPEEVIELIRSVTLPRSRYNWGENGKLFEGEICGGGFTIYHGTHISQDNLRPTSGPVINGFLYRPEHGTIIKLEIRPRLFHYLFLAFLIIMMIVTAVMFLKAGIENRDLKYSLSGLIPIGVLLVIVMVLASNMKDSANHAVKELKELLEAEDYTEYI